MQSQRLLHISVLGGVLLSTACAGKTNDNEETNQATGEHAPSAGAAAPPAMQPPAFDFNTALAPFTTGGAPLCLAGEDVCTAPTEASGKQPDGVLEINLTNSPDRKDGEPSLAINPKNPDNLVVIYASFLPGQLLTSGAYGSNLQYSMDRGETWTLLPWPPEGTGPFPDCGESVVKVDSDGTFYAGMNNLLNTTNLEEGQDANLNKAVHIVSRSTDGGRTWSKPVQTYQISGVIKSRVDLVTGKLYHTVSSGGLFPAAMTVSSDRGETWSQPFQQPGNQYAVHDGVLVVASDSPSIVINVSTDDGQTFRQVPVTDSSGKPAVPGAMGFQDPAPWVTADPTKSGRFAVMVPQTAGLRLQGFVPVFDTYDVYVTDNTGESWTGPTTIKAPWSALPWIDFGSSGALGVTWRGITNVDGKALVDAYATVSFDQGRTFSAALRVNAESHPWGDNGPPADDWSWISIDDTYAFITWVDVRSGNTGDAIMARVPLSLFSAKSPMSRP